MSVPIDITYEGQLHTTAVHGPSGAKIATDAPKDNMGKGEAFSPTDLLATALGTCIITTMAIVGQREGLTLGDATVHVEKEMTATGPRRVAKLAVVVNLKGQYTDVQRQKLTNAAHACPVHKSLHPDVQVELTLNWADA